MGRIVGLVFPKTTNVNPDSVEKAAEFGINKSEDRPDVESTANVTKTGQKTGKAKE